MRLLRTTFFVLCYVIMHASGSVFKAAVYEHAFVGLKDRTYVPTRQEALHVVMKNMDVYEQQIKIAKSEVFYVFYTYMIIISLNLSLSLHGI